MTLLFTSQWIRLISIFHKQILKYLLCIDAKHMNWIESSWVAHFWLHSMAADYCRLGHDCCLNVVETFKMTLIPNTYCWGYAFHRTPPPTEKPLRVITTSRVEVHRDGMLQMQWTESYMMCSDLFTIFSMHSSQYIMLRVQNVLHIITSLYLLHTIYNLLEASRLKM